MAIEYGDGSDSNAGRIVQVVTNTKDDTASFSSGSSSPSSLENTFNISVTPTSSSHKVLVKFTLTVGVNGSTAITGALYRKISSTETALLLGQASGSRDRITTGIACNNGHNITCLNVEYLDSPNTTSSCKYYLKLSQMTGSTEPYYLGRSHNDSDQSSYARGSCHALLMEVAA